MPPEKPQNGISADKVIVAESIVVHGNWVMGADSSPAPTIAKPPQIEPKIVSANQGGLEGTWGLSKPHLVKTVAVLVLLMACVYPLPLFFDPPARELTEPLLAVEKNLFIHNQILLFIFDLAVLGGLAFAAGKWRSAGNVPVATSMIRAFSLWFVATYALIVRQLQLAEELTAKTLNNVAPSMTWSLWLGGICLLISAATLVFSLLGAWREHLQ